MGRHSECSRTKHFSARSRSDSFLPLAIPTVIAQLVNMLYNIVDRIYIGHIPEVGSAALTGVGVRACRSS